MNLFRTFWYFFMAMNASILGILSSVFRPFGFDVNWFTSRLFYYTVAPVVGISVEVDGDPRALQGKSVVYIANHQGMLDLLIFSKVYPKHTVITAKRPLAFVPVFGWYLFLAGNVFFHRKKRQRAVAALNEAVKSIDGTGQSLWIFPEGTRSHKGTELNPFKKGAFYAARELNCPIVTFVASSLDEVGCVEKRWIKGGKVHIKILEETDPKEWMDASIQDMSNLHRGRMQNAIDALNEQKVVLPNQAHHEQAKAY